MRSAKLRYPSDLDVVVHNVSCIISHIECDGSARSAFGNGYYQRDGDVNIRRSISSLAPTPICNVAYHTSFAHADTVNFREVFGARSNRASVIAYTDEVTPGQALKCDNRRKVIAVHWSVLKLDATYLAYEHLLAHRSHREINCR